MVTAAEIFVDRLRVHALIGVDAQERVIGNDFEVSVSVTYPPAVEAGRTDALGLTVNYAEIVEIVKSVMAREMLLVEHAADLIISRIRERWPEAASCRITVAKLAPPVAGCQCAAMGVTFQWSK